MLLLPGLAEGTALDPSKTVEQTSISCSRSPSFSLFQQLPHILSVSFPGCRGILRSWSGGKSCRGVGKAPKLVHQMEVTPQTHRIQPLPVHNIYLFIFPVHCWGRSGWELVALSGSSNVERGMLHNKCVRKPTTSIVCCCSQVPKWQVKPEPSVSLPLQIVLVQLCSLMCKWPKSSVNAGFPEMVSCIMCETANVVCLESSLPRTELAALLAYKWKVIFSHYAFVFIRMKRWKAKQDAFLIQLPTSV